MGGETRESCVCKAMEENEAPSQDDVVLIDVGTTEKGSDAHPTAKDGASVVTSIQY